MVGLDLSVSRTGIAWLDGSTTSTKVPGKVKGGDRLALLMLQIEPALRRGGASDHPSYGQPLPDLLVIEDYSPGAVGINGKLTNAELCGCVLLLASQRRIPVAKVRANTLKRYATGNGSADKDAMVAAAHAQGWDGATHDEADAAWLRWLGLAHLSGDDLTGRLALADGVSWPDVAGLRQETGT